MEDPVPEVAENHDVRRVSLNGVDDLAPQPVGHDAVVDPVDLEHPMMIGDEPLLEGGGPAGVDESPRRHPGGGQVVDHEGPQLVVAQDGRERHLGSNAADVLGHHGGAAHEGVGVLEPEAEARGLGALAEERAVRVAVNDGVAHDVRADAAEIVQGRPQLIEADALGLQQRDQLVDGEPGLVLGDDRARRVDDVAGREHHFAAVRLERADLLLRLGRQRTRLILEALGEEVGLDDPDALDRSLVGVDDDIVHELERGQVGRAELLRHVRAVGALRDVGIRRHAGDKHVRLLLGVHEMAQVTGMDDVEGAMTHDGRALPRTRAEEGRQLRAGLDLVSELFVHDAPASPGT